jgi:hypothetical protein|tara:strand:+ start:320 stop:433 length:114 start_codon:yes stop_codon:yes gene_type:complete
MEIIGIFTIMMLPMIAGGITMLYSYKATKHIGQEMDE